MKPEADRLLAKAVRSLQRRNVADYELVGEIAGEEAERILDQVAGFAQIREHLTTVGSEQ